MRSSLRPAALVLVALVAPREAQSQAQPATGLASYFTGLRERRLVDLEAASLRELRALLADGEALLQEGRHEDAALVLFEIVESPRFADYSESDEVFAALYALASALHELGAERSARDYLHRVLARGPDGAYFGPAFRRYCDVALASGALAEAVAALDALGFALPTDADSERQYLRGKEREAAGDGAAAEQAYLRVGKRSRFYASARYLLGALAVRREKMRQAETHFCKIASVRDSGPFSFYVDARYFRIKDLARLALGRVAHEERRGDDAYYYYFQVPHDSPRLPEALFEAAYAAYESRDHDNAIDLLDQLQARFPRSPYADEAWLLRGYVSLARCDFERAQRLFARFIRRFSPLVATIDRIGDSPARRARLYRELAAPRRSTAPRSPAERLLASLLKVDPEFAALHAQVRKLDAEVARGGLVPDLLRAIAARLHGVDAPKPAPGAAARGDLEELSRQIVEARAASSALTRQLDEMRRLGAKESALRALEARVADLGRRTERVAGRVADARRQALGTTRDTDAPVELGARLQRDAADAERLMARAALLRTELLSTANARAYAALRALRDRLASFLRRARIGRIDAVMGSKRRIEAQIESLAAGRFPPELRDPLLVQGFLADSEEYWPFEGEDWPDEYIERHDDLHAGVP